MLKRIRLSYNIFELYKTPKSQIVMIDKNDKAQTPAPKVSSRKDPSEEKESNLKKTMAQAEKGAKSKTGATKTPQKIQDGNLNESKKEY